jgi:hypothetical protein
MRVAVEWAELFGSSGGSLSPWEMADDSTLCCENEQRRPIAYFSACSCRGRIERMRFGNLKAVVPLAIPETARSVRAAVARPYACRGGELQGLGSQLKSVGRVLR